MRKIICLLSPQPAVQQSTLEALTLKSRVENAENSLASSVASRVSISLGPGPVGEG